MANLCWWYYISKLTEFVDTVRSKRRAARRSSRYVTYVCCFRCFSWWGKRTIKSVCSTCTIIRSHRSKHGSASNSSPVSSPRHASYVYIYNIKYYHRIISAAFESQMYPYITCIQGASERYDGFTLKTHSKIYTHIHTRLCYVIASKARWPGSSPRALGSQKISESSNLSNTPRN